MDLTAQDNQLRYKTHGLMHRCDVLLGCALRLVQSSRLYHLASLGLPINVLRVLRRLHQLARQGAIYNLIPMLET